MSYVNFAPLGIPVAGDIPVYQADGSVLWTTPAVPSAGVDWVATMWVNADAASFAAADGTPGNPFATIQEAHDALPLTGGTIMVVPAPVAGYPANLAFNRIVNLIALCVGTLGGITQAQQGIAVGDITSDSFLTAFGIDGGTWTKTGGATVMKGCSASGNVVCTAALISEDSMFNGTTEASEIHAQTSTFAGNVTVNNAVMDCLGCIVGDGGASVTFVGGAGILGLDSYSNYIFIAGGGSIVNGTKTVLGDLTP